MKDDLTKVLEQLSGDLPKPRIDLSPTEKAELVARVGPRTARDIVRAKRDFQLRRVPFLFSAVNTQDVVDLLANDVEDVILQALGEVVAKGRE